MTIKIESVELDNGRTRRMAIDSEAPDNPSPNDMFSKPKCVAVWDVEDVDGVRRGTFLMVRPDLQGRGYLKKLTQQMTELLGDTKLEMVNVIQPAVLALKDGMLESGAEVETVYGGK